MLFDDNRIILGLNESAYTPALTLSAVPSNKFGVSFINPTTKKQRNLILRNPVGEALELLYNATEDNIYLGMGMTKISAALGAYTIAQADAKFRLISDSYTKSEVDNKTEIDAKTTVLQAGINITHTKVESDARYYTKSDVYNKSEIDAKTAVLQAGIDITYTKVESDARYYTKSESDLKLGLKADFNVGQLPNLFNKTEITNMLGIFYDTSQIDGVIDQKYIFSNPGGNLNQR